VRRKPVPRGRSEVWDRRAVVAAARRERSRIGGRLQELRRELGLSQERAAERIGIHAKHLLRIEQGDANVTITTLVAAALAYGVELRDLVARTPKAAR
jgi:transcriptional regulator with XRE-family HTH domain